MPQAKRKNQPTTDGRWFHVDDPGESSLGTAIKLRRTELGLSRRELAERANLSYPYVAELENGKKEGSPRALEAIAGALELRPSELLAWSDDLVESRGSSPSDPQHWRHRNQELPSTSSAPLPPDSMVAPPAAAAPAPARRAAPGAVGRGSGRGQLSPRMLAAEIARLLDRADPAVAEEALLMALGERRLEEIVRRSRETDDRRNA